MNRNRLTLCLGLALALIGVADAALAAPSGRPVPTETIIVPHGNALASQGTAPSEANPQPTNAAPAATGDTPTAPDQSKTPAPPAAPATPGTGAAGAVVPDENVIPPVEYDLAKLPAPVKRLREQIIAAAATGDPEKLRPIIDANGEPPALSLNDVGDPITFIKSLSGDPEGREILAILTEVLEAGFVHVDIGTPDEVYLWPYFARYPVDKLTPPQLVELFKLVYAGDYEDMKAYGSYSYYRVGIAPDGTWKFFMAGD